MTIPYKWGCSFTINGLRVPADTTINGINLETIVIEDGRSKTNGNFILELNEMRTPKKEEIEKTVISLIDALTVLYFFGSVSIEEPKLLNEEELLSYGQDVPMNLQPLTLTMNIINKRIEPNKIDTIIQNLEKPDNNKNRYVVALRWMRKVALDDDIFNKFISSWIAFNAIYSIYYTSSNGGEQNTIEKFVDNEFDCCKAEDLLIKRLREDDIKIIANSGLKLRNSDVTADLRTEWEQIKQGESNNFMKCMKLLVLSLYALRNSIFHGDFLHGQQHRLLNTSTDILIIIMRYFLKKTLLFK